jgi:signal transduction histidine kinase/CheY-like chemotaxis protein
MERDFSSLSVGRDYKFSLSPSRFVAAAVGFIVVLLLFFSPLMSGLSQTYADDGEVAGSFYVNFDDSTFYVKEGFSAPNPNEPHLDFSGSEWQPAKLATNGTIIMRDYVPSLKGKLPGFLSLRKDAIKEFTIATTFEFTEAQIEYLNNANNSAPGIYLSSIGDNWEVYLNGYLICGEVHLDAKGEITQHCSYRDVISSIRGAYFREGTNTLEIRIIGDPADAYTGLYYEKSYYIDKLDSINSSNSDILTIIFCTVFVFIGLYHLLLYFFRRSSQENLAYAAFSVTSATYFFLRSHHIYRLISDTATTQRLEYATLFALLILFAIFIEVLSHRRILLPTKIAGILTIFYIVALWISEMRFAYDVLRLWQLAMCLPMLVYVVFYDVLYTYIKSAKVEKEENSISMGAALRNNLIHTVLGNLVIFIALLFASVVVDIIDEMFLHSGMQLSRYSLFVFSVCIAFLLAAQYASTFKRVDAENENLEQQIEARTKELRKQVEISEASSKSKSDFMATVSHEIRTPLNAILGLSELEMHKEDIAPKTRLNLDKIHRSGITLKEIVDDMLDIAKIEVGGLEISEKVYDIAPVISDVINPQVIKNTGKPIIFHAHISPDIPRALLGDPTRSKQVFSNILSNSLKFTEHGDVNVKMWYEPYEMSVVASGEMPEWVYICASFADTGVGIDEEDLGAIFEGYSQLDMTSSRKVGGTGLGLYITKKILDMMGGTIKVESEPGKGSTFTVRIPQHVEDPAPIGEDTAFALSNMKWTGTGNDDDGAKVTMRGRVLVADDVALNLEVVVGLLQQYKLDIDCVLNGEDAVEKMRGSVSGTNAHYDLILMDHMMPGMDGVEAMQAIRALGGYAADVPIVVLTANALEGNEELFLKSGFDAYMSKPINPNDFEQVLYKYIHNRNN